MSLPADRRYWSLVCNPQKFDGAAAAAALDEMAWTIDRSNPVPGDRVALWQSKGRGSQRGIVGLGEVTRGIVDEPCPTPEHAYWRVPDNGSEPRIRFALVRGVGLPLWDGPANDWLGDLMAARATGGTVFSLRPEEWWLAACLAEASPVATDARPALSGASRQGYRSDPLERRAVERRAQGLAEQYFISRGYDVEDVSLTECFDLRCTKGGEEIRVEAKGTTGAGECVLLTRNEVDHARANPDKVVLAVVSGISLRRGGTGPIAEGGTLAVFMPWRIDDGTMNPTQYEYRVTRRSEPQSPD